MNKFLPSKKFSLIILSIILALGIIYVFSYLKNSSDKTIKSSALNPETQAKVKAYMVLDSDNDGLPDWEEALYKTDPKKADTDGDGTNDAEELKLNRDPLKANTAKAGQEPNDKISEAVIAANNKVLDDFNKLTDTDRMGRMLFSPYLATKKVGETLSDTEIANIIQNTISEMPAIPFTLYIQSDIKTSTTTTTETIKNYGNDISKIIVGDLLQEKIKAQDYDIYGFTQVQNIISAMQVNATDQELKQKFNDLGPIIEKYKLLTSDLLKVMVPNDLISKHLNLINTFRAVGDDLQKIKDSQDNIIILPSLLTIYSNDTDKIWGVLGETGDIFTANHIIFSQTDFGYLLFDVIINKQ